MGNEAGSICVHFEAPKGDLFPPHLANLKNEVVLNHVGRYEVVFSLDIVALHT